MIISNSLTNTNKTSTSSSPPPVLKQYPYRSSDKSEIDKLIGKPVASNTLQVIPTNVTYKVLEQPPPPPPPIYQTISFTNLSVSVTNPKRHTTIRMQLPGMGFDSLTPEEQAQANLAQLTNTELQCYIAPPSKNVISLEGVIFVAKIFFFRSLINYTQ